MTIINKKAMLMLLSSTLLGFTASAANKKEEVPISTIISTGTQADSLEKAANLWFMLDDSGSMGRTKINARVHFSRITEKVARDLGLTGNAGFYCENSRYPGRLNCVSAFHTNQIEMGYIPYNSALVYQLPKKPDGTDMPKPKPNRYYIDPYRDALKIGANKTFQSYPETRSSWIGWDSVTYSMLYANDNVGATPICGSDENCLIWKSYYSSRIKSLKASLSIALNSERNQEYLENLRVGYRSLNNNVLRDPRIPRTNPQILPVIPLSGKNKAANKNTMIKWLYSLQPGNLTPTRSVVSSMLNDIAGASRNTRRNNPFLAKPGQRISEKNPILGCRRNYMLVMTDGEWNLDSEATVRNTLSSAGFNLSNLNRNTNFPTPFRTNELRPRTSRNPRVDVMTLTDIAYTAWANDIDNNSKNNTLKEKWAYEETSGGEKIKTNPNATQNPQYWHPHNDPATWQHMNTYTIGFGLSNGNIDINDNIDLKATRDLVIGERFFENNFGQLIPRDQITNPADDLANAAIAGRGHYYDAQTAQDLMEAFDDLLNSAAKTGTTEGVKGSGGSTGHSQSAGSAHFSTRYSDRTKGEKMTYTVGGELVRQSMFDGVNNCFKDSTTKPPYGTLCEKEDWNAAKKLSEKNAWSKRHIISSQRVKTAYQQINFYPKSLNEDSVNRLLMKKKGGKSTHALLSKIDEKEQLSALVNYVKGSPSYEINDVSDKKVKQKIFRSRNQYPFGKSTGRNILGIIMRSSPAYSDVPRISGLHPRKQEDDYVNFVERYIWGRGKGSCVAEKNCIDRHLVNLIFVGSNDGMLHAFQENDGSEVFAYVPNAVYDNLAKLTEKENTSFVDGNIRIETINISANGKKEATTWQRLLTGTMGAGGKGLYALDITNPKQKQNLVKWEYSDFESVQHQVSSKVKNPKSNVGNIIGKPGVIQLADGTWAVVVGNGYNSESGKAALLVINADTGKTIQELVVENDADHFTDASLPNGLSPASFVAFAGKDSETAARVDRAYAGDLQGNLWVFDFTKSSAKGGVRVASGTNRVAPLFTATYNRGKGIARQPITTTPLVKVHPSKYGYLVHFGTGALFEEDDLSTKVNNSVYAIWDDWVASGSGNGSGLPNPRQGNVVQRAHLNALHFNQLKGEGITTNDETKAQVRTLSADNRMTQWAFSGTNFGQKSHRGWYIDLLPKERAWQSAYDTFGDNDVVAIGYNTVRYNKASDHDNDLSCETASSTVESWKLAFNPDDGAENLPMFGTLDVNGDGKNTKNDTKKKLSDSDKESAAVSGHKKSGVEFNSSLSAVRGEPDGIAGNDYSPGSKLCTYLNDTSENSNGSITSRQVCRSSRNASWREIHGN